jgi:predicted CopG family antitoxin
MNESQSVSDVVREERKMLNVRKETWERLQSFGRFRESTDDLLNRLMDNMAKVSKK